MRKKAAGGLADPFSFKAEHALDVAADAILGVVYGVIGAAAIQAFLLAIGLAAAGFSGLCRVGARDHPDRRSVTHTDTGVQPSCRTDPVAGSHSSGSETQPQFIRTSSLVRRSCIRPSMRPIGGWHSGRAYLDRSARPRLLRLRDGGLVRYVRSRNTKYWISDGKTAFTAPAARAIV